MKKIFLVLILLTFSYTFAQSKLKITPNNISYENFFNRLRIIQFINEGTENIRIDSLVYNKSFYWTRFNKPIELPYEILPNDTLTMECIIWNYWVVTPADTNHTILTYNNGSNPVEEINISVSSFVDDLSKGTISGNITDDANPIENATIYFFRNASTLYDSALTNQDGFYSIELQKGLYTIAASKNNFYVSFFDKKLSPFLATEVLLEEDSVKIVDIILKKMQETSYSVSGTIFDFSPNQLGKKVRARRGVVVVRTGTHNPSVNLNKLTSDENIYSGIIEEDGTYEIKNIARSGTYFVQAFTDFYLPSYFNLSNSPQSFWQDADSLVINSDLLDVNIYLKRDSTYGAGTISGQVILDSTSVGKSLNEISVFAKGAGGKIYAHSYVSENGNYRFTSLPFGKYQILAQSFGAEDVLSNEVELDSTNLKVEGVSITLSLTLINNISTVPNSFKLFQNYPNPFNPNTKIKYQISKQSYVQLTIYDLLGRQVSQLVNEVKRAGVYEINFDASTVASGVYFYKLQVVDSKTGLLSSRYDKIRKMIFLK